MKAPFDKAIELTGLASIVALWAIVIYYFPSLHDTIPIHYNIHGKVDGYGSKVSLMSLPLVATLLFAGLTALNRYPHIFNYTRAVTEENAQSLYTNTTRMIRILSIAIVIAFSMIALRTIQIAINGYGSLWVILVPVIFCVLIFLPLYYIIKLRAKA